MSTGIEWTDETWNPVTGCTKVSEGCRHCYAERLWPKVQGAAVARANKRETELAVSFPRPFTDVRCHPDRLEMPLRWKKSRRIFVNSMSDLFHEDVPDEFVDRVFAVMALCPQHIFQVLTKRPERMREYLSRGEREVLRRIAIQWTQMGDKVGNGPTALTDWPLPNVWLGVSAEDQDTAEARIPLLLETPASVRFVSLEPLLGAVDLEPWTWAGAAVNGHKQMARLDWVIVGGESGPGARPMHPDWVRQVRNQCAQAGVPFFFKQWGEWAAYRETEDDGCRCRVPHEEGCPKIHFWEYTGTGGPAGYEPRGVLVSRKVGKRTAGARLDGREHREVPDAKQGENGK